jgi:site-specific recombinase XerD
MRAKNLASLDINQHFDFVSDTQAHIIIESDDVKNKVMLNYVLGARFMKLYRLYVLHYRPLLSGEYQTSALFISRTGRTKNPAELATQLQSFIKEGTGLRMNVHLFRHLTGYIFLRHYPGEYEPVRQLLGHKSVKTTIAFYVGLEEDATFKRYGAILDELIAKEEINAAF